MHLTPHLQILPGKENHLLRLTILFLILSIAAVMITMPDTKQTTRQNTNAWDGTITIRMEGRNCPLYYPQNDE